MFGFSLTKILLLVGVVSVVWYVWHLKDRKSVKKGCGDDETLVLCETCGFYHVRGAPCVDKGGNK